MLNDDLGIVNVYWYAVFNDANARTGRIGFKGYALNIR